MRYHLGLGSNLGDPKTNLARARRALRRHGIRTVRASSLYRTQPVGLADQPWFFNQALEVVTDLSPLELLRRLKRIERDLGRTKGVVNGPRVIDLDILLAGDLIIQRAELTIPHPRLHERNFVLGPLAEIAGEAVHPVFQVRIRELWERTTDHAVIERWEGQGSGRSGAKKKRSGCLRRSSDRPGAATKR